ncbi:hypothetical protein C0992_009949, partial [Termitomyces sp. T32_za158]
MSLFPNPPSVDVVEADLICSHVEPASFSDGNLILLVDEMTFKVHISMFIRQSAQFKTLWETRPSQSGEILTVRIHGKDPVDFAFMFMAIYRMDESLIGRGPMGVDAIDSLLHFGDRFNISYLYDTVAER